MEIGKIRRFKETDWYSYEGAEKFRSGSDPLICEGKFEDFEIVIVVDQSGVFIQIFGGDMFELDNEEGGYKEIEEVTYCWNAPEPLGALRAIGYIGHARKLVEESTDMGDLIYKLESDSNYECQN